MDLEIFKLNIPQKEAACHGSGPMLVLAGAGSGKTRVVTQRIARLLTHGVPAKRIVAVTFTNKAAEEMKERVAQLAGRPVGDGLFIGTFHRLGASILRQEIHALDYPNQFSIFDYGDQLAAMTQVMQNIGADTGRYNPREVLNRVSLAKAAFIKPGDSLPGGDPIGLIATKAYKPYQQKLKVMGAVDFEDLLFLPVCLLKENPDILEKWQSSVDHVLVDEYQDTNQIQFQLIKLLSERTNNLFVVGDDDQSIYAWRGADHTNILRFQEHFSEAKVVFLTQNYRSTGPILKAANTVIKNNPYRMDKELWTEGDQGEPIRIVRCNTPEKEANFVAQDIQCRAMKEGIPYGQFGILYRTNAQATILEDVLATLSIPYQTVGGTDFYDRKEIKDFLAYLQLLVNPKNEISLRRIINYPLRGIGDTTVEALGNLAARQGMTLWDTCKAVAAGKGGDGFQPRAVNSIKNLVQIIEDATATMWDKGALAGAKLLVDRLRFIDAVIRGERSDKIANRKAYNIKSLLHALDFHTQNSKDPSLIEFISIASLDPREDKNKDAPASDNVLTLMTLHSAKGLEFPIVYMVGLEEGLLPHRERVGGTLAPISPADLAEERRLFYVGITRARKALTMTLSRYRRYRGYNTTCQPSRYLAELPREDLIDCSMSEAKKDWDQDMVMELNKQKAASFFGELSDLFG